MSGPDAPPFKNPHIGFWTADDQSLYSAAAYLTLIATFTLGILFPFLIVAGSMYFSILYYILRMQSSSTIEAVQAEMFPSCTVDIHVKSKEHFAIVVFLASSIYFMVVLPLVAIGLYYCCSALKSLCASCFSSSSSSLPSATATSIPIPTATATAVSNSSPTSSTNYSTNKPKDGAFELVVSDS